MTTTKQADLMVTLAGLTNVQLLDSYAAIAAQLGASATTQDANAAAASLSLIRTELLARVSS